MAKKKSVVWIWKEKDGWYIIGKKYPNLIEKNWRGKGAYMFCPSIFQRYFPFFKLPPNSLGKITNTANALTFEIVETKP